MKTKTKKVKEKDPFDIMIEDLYQESKSIRRKSKWKYFNNV